jgi:hypothetical protein
MSVCCVLCVVCCQVEFSATCRSINQRSPTECCVSECDGEASTVKSPWPIWGSRAMEINNGQVNEHSESITSVLP